MVHLEPRDDVAVLRMEHGKANAFDTKLLDELVSRLGSLETSPACAIVLTGTGTIFSAGVDLFRIVEGGRPYVERFLPAFRDALIAYFTFPKPVVAAVNGHAVAGGCVFACACDYRIMADGNGRIGVPELRVGLPFPAVALQILQATIPRRPLRRLIWLGDTVTPGDALQIGLVDEVVPPAEVVNRAVAVARDLGALKPEAFGLTKRLLRQPSLERAGRLDQSSDAEVVDAWASAETRETIRGYLHATLKRQS